MSEPLTGSQEEHVREIAFQEVLNALRLLADEVVEGGRIWRALHETIKRLDRGEVA